MASSSVAAPNRPNLTITSPLLNAKFYITKDAVWPSVIFHTDAVLDPGEQLHWEWSVQWRHFSAGGAVQTNAPFWDAQTAIADYGGSLTVIARRGIVSTASTSVQILGTQPDSCDVIAYLNTHPGSSGFDKILAHESCMKHFDGTGNPEHSFDNGYGMAQLTEPPPTYQQVWNWKHNVNGALSLYAEKRAAAIAYLSRHGSYTERQLVHETVSRWNGGSYHLWDSKLGWIRKPTILCDSKTGNIGWDITREANKGKSEAVLHARDAACYGHAPRSSDAWNYFGVCYADAVLGV